MSGFPVCIFCLFALPGPAVAAQDMRTEEVHFNRGESRTTIMGKVTGCQTVDYHVRGGAGQTLAVTLKPSSPSAYFNVLPPGATDAAMFVGSHAGNRLKRVLTDDGTYMIRVYLMRHAARLNKSSTYSLAISVTGTALVPIPSSIDATVPGTRFHASAQVACVPPYAYDTGEQACEAFVIRRGFDGTATVEIRSANGQKRSILFVAGKAVAADAQDPLTFTRRDDITIVSFGDKERYEIPDALITGGCEPEGSQRAGCIP